MKVIGLDGRTYAWKLTRKTPTDDDDLQRSELHLRTRAFLHTLYPLERILEEVYLPGSGDLTVDFFIPTRKLFVEAHGVQHYKFVPFFHETQLGFIQACKRDKDKRHWAELNNLTYVELPYNESTADWRDRVISLTTITEC
jgi:hypothetical protein